MAPVRLAGNMTLLGSGEKTVLHKVDGFRTRFIVDADYGELKLTVEDASGFKPDMGVQIYDETQNEGWAVTTAVVTAVEGNIVYIDNYLVRDYRSDKDGIISNACSIVEAVKAENIHLADLLIDGNREKNETINGCRGGAVYLHWAKNCVVENVKVTNFAGDGISWQITENITVRNCEVTGCGNTGLHPGTGSPNTVMEGNNCHHNDKDGLFICWRVQHSLVKDNHFHHNGRFGICTGHKDSDVLFEGNHIHHNGSDGVHFRGERESNGAHRNTFRKNIIEDNGIGDDEGCGFYINGETHDILIEDNTIRDTGKGTQKIGVFVKREAKNVDVKNNQMSGHIKGNVVRESE